MSMEFKVTIYKDGKVVSEVIDRGEHLCSDINKVNARLGRVLSDEEIGPECGPTAHEVEVQ